MYPGPSELDRHTTAQPGIVESVANSGRGSAMKKILLPSMFVVLLAAHPGALGQERHEAPLHSDGDHWQFRVVEHGDYMKTDRELNGVYELIYKSGRFRAFKVEGSRKAELKSDTGLLVGLLAQTEKLQYLQFPLYKGRSWTTEYMFRPRRRDADRLVKAVTSVTDFGATTTEIGTFQTFTIERDARFRDVDHWRFGYFWSPRTRSVVKYLMEVLKGAAAGSKREIELIQFGPAR